ncbi:MAG: hypothetical protein ACLP01_29650 [Solirubrobacteraceae bacterium]
MPPQPKFPYTTADVAASREEIRRAFPNLDQQGIEYGVACEVIINIFGPDWWGTRLAGSRPDPYFAKERETGLRPVHDSRVIGLADDLMTCQYFAGFSEQREQLATRSLIAVYHELRVARMLHKNGHRVEFVIPRGEKGVDYDLCVDNVLATEVKAKEDDTEFTAASVRNSLSDAQSQLPAEGPGLIVLRVPDAWVGDLGIEKAMCEVIEDRLRNSHRVNGVLVLWDEWVAGPAGGLRGTRFRMHTNPTPRREFSDLAHLLSSDVTPNRLAVGLPSPGAA